jgi:O-antigen ligase
MVLWMVYVGEDSLRRLKIIINLNYFVFFFLTFSLLPSALRLGKGLAVISQFYKLPFGLGVVNRNGVGRYALIVIIVSAVRLISYHNIRRWLWLLPIFPAGFLLAQTESRTALLGLAMITVVFFLLKGINLRFLLLAPAALFLVYTVGFRTRAQGNLNQLVYLSGREAAWNQGFQWIKESPLLGWGFHADRIMMNEAHMHNSYLHAAIQEGGIGFILFAAAIVGIWALMLLKNVFKVSRHLEGQDQVLLMESVLIVAFLTSRSFFESTAAFYGVDLLLLIPAMAFISMMLREPDTPETEPEAIA